jgi:hypothetical protein
MALENGEKSFQRIMGIVSHQSVSWSSGYDFPLTIASSKCSGKVLGSIPRETIFFSLFLVPLLS